MLCNVAASLSRWKLRPIKMVSSFVQGSSAAIWVALAAAALQEGSTGQSIYFFSAHQVSWTHSYGSQRLPAYMGACIAEMLMRNELAKYIHDRCNGYVSRPGALPSSRLPNVAKEQVAV